MSNDFLGQILGSVLGGRTLGQQSPMDAGTGGGLGSMGGLGNVLGGLMGRGAGSGGGLGGMGGGQGGGLTGMLLPLAMQWVQRNGGLGGVLQQFQQKGYSREAASWVSTGANENLPPEAIGNVMGSDELSRLSQQLGASKEEVAGGMAQILPEVVNHMTPEGNVPHNADDVLGRGLAALENLMHSSQPR